MSAATFAVEHNFTSSTTMSSGRLRHAYLTETKFECLRALRAPAFAIPFLLLPIVLYVLFFALAMALGPLALIGLPVELLLGVGVLVCIIMGAVKASSGEEFEPPVVSAICKALFKV